MNGKLFGGSTSRLIFDALTGKFHGSSFEELVCLHSSCARVFALLLHFQGSILANCRASELLDPAPGPLRLESHGP